METSLIIKNIDVETSYIEVADDVTISEISNYQVITFLCFQTENLSYKRILHESQTWDQAESTLPRSKIQIIGDHSDKCLKVSGCRF